MKGREFKNIIYSQLAKISKALADPHRIEIIDLLCQGQKNVESISKDIGLPFAATSHHLQVLRESGLVLDIKKGRFVFYQALQSAREIFYCLGSIGKKHYAQIQMAMEQFFSGLDKIEKIKFPELINKIKSGKTILIDVRPPDEFQAGHFPGAISFPLKELNSRIGELPKDTEIIAYCRGKYCVMSHSAVLILNRKKIKASILLDGVNDWLMEGRFLEKEAPQPNNIRRS